MRLTRISALLLAALLAQSTALADNSITISQLKKAGVKPVACPKYVLSPKTGLASSIIPKTTACVSSEKLPKKAAKKIGRSTQRLDGKWIVGEAFPDVEYQEGDCQTAPFLVKNFPAIISYSVEESNFKSSFEITIVDAATGKERHKILTGRGSVEGETAWNVPGRYYLKMNAFGDSREELQPKFSVSMRFMDPYEGYSISASDMKEAGLKTLACPAATIDLNTGRMSSLKKFICTKSEAVTDAGFTIAPYNTGIEMFMTNGLDDTGAGDKHTLPFRVTKPTILTYSVDDPGAGKGSLVMDLIDLSTGKKMDRLVTVKGSIAATSTSINIPGDYYLFIQTSPYNPEENGDIEWSISIMETF